MGTGKPMELAHFIDQFYGPEVELRVGSDSQNIAGFTIYVSAVVIRYPNNGARVLYQKEKILRIKDLWTRLWNEAERSVTLANGIKENLGATVACIDMDYNSDPEFPSHKVWKAAKGYAESTGFKAKAKPDLLWATWAANYLCS